METTTSSKEIKVSIRKGWDKQWSATSYIELENDRMLRISTFKNSRGILYTSVQAVKHEKTSTGFSGESFVLFQDYNKTVRHFPEVKRVTEAVIADCHSQSLMGIKQYVEDANEFYKTERLTDEV